jgi:hypothetical protein
MIIGARCGEELQREAAKVAEEREEKQHSADHAKRDGEPRKNQRIFLLCPR